MVWCQTGGWTKFRKLTFVHDSSVWNEINTFVTLRIFRDGMAVEPAVREYHERHGAGRGTWADLLQLLRLSDEVVKEALYIDGYAQQKLFFRRTRLPTLLSVYWDRVLVNHSMRKLLRCFVADGEAAIAQGWAALEKIAAMRSLAARLGLPVADFDRMRDTFEILAAAREYYFRPFDPATVERLRGLKRDYKTRHPRHQRYSVKLDFDRVRVRRAHLRWLLAVLLRRQRGYRLVDRILTVHVLARIYPLVRRWNRRLLPRGLGEQAMGVDAVFK
jgi:hypothetical protein